MAATKAEVALLREQLWLLTSAVRQVRDLVLELVDSVPPETARQRRVAGDGRKIKPKRANIAKRSVKAAKRAK